MTDMDMPLPEPPKGNDRLALEVHRLMNHYRIDNGDELYRTMRAIVAAEVAKEREKCAKLCDEQAHVIEAAAALADADDRPAMLSTSWKIKLCAAAIRAGSPGTAPPSEPV